MHLGLLKAQCATQETTIIAAVWVHDRAWQCSCTFLPTMINYKSCKSSCQRHLIDICVSTEPNFLLLGFYILHWVSQVAISQPARRPKGWIRLNASCRKHSMGHVTYQYRRMLSALSPSTRGACLSIDIALQASRGRCGQDVCCIHLDKRDNCHGAAVKTLAALIPGRVQGEMVQHGLGPEVGQRHIQCARRYPCHCTSYQNLESIYCGITRRNENSNAPKPHPAVKPWTSSGNHEGKGVPSLESVSGI